MNMSLEEKNVNLAVSRRRYAQLTTKTEKGLFLDQFCSTTGLDRKHSIKQLRKRKLPVKRGCPRRYDMNARKLLVEIWKLSGRLSGKLLHAVVLCWLESLKRRGSVDPAAERQLLSMSASTMDRLLRHAKHRCGGGGGRRRSESLQEHRRQVPLKVDFWPECTPNEAGWIEADTVAHCGGSMAGSFAWSVVFTDVPTQWTEFRCVWNKGAEGVCLRFEEVVGVFPFNVQAMNSDNGSEFLNQHMARYFPEFCPDARHTRSRPYRKNDNAHVEQKNGHRVRRLFGYGRVDQAQLVKPMNEIAILQSRFDNLYSPTQRLLSKHREGRKYVKRFENPPKTPAMRILEDPFVDESHKNQVRLMLDQNDPIDLLAAIQAKKREIQKLSYEIEKCAPSEKKHMKTVPGGPAGPPGNAGLCPPKGPPPEARAWCRPL